MNGEAPEKAQAESGVGVDKFGWPAFDPSKNVQSLNEASSKRQDDLREAAQALSEVRIVSLEKIMGLRDQFYDKLAAAESRRVDEQLVLRAQYEERLSLAEAKRIDAIRAVDVNAVSVASQRASDQATVLASQVAQSAEALRALVASTANTVAQSQQQLATTLSTRITTLEQAQYEGKGKQSFADPAFMELLSEVKSLQQSNKQAAGVGQGISTSWGVLIAVAGLAAAMFVAFGPGRQAPPSPTPQIIYSPAPLATPGPPPATK